MSLILSSMLVISATSRLQQAVKSNIPWWFWLIMATALGLLIWMLFNRPKEEGEETHAEVVKAPEVEPGPTPVLETKEPFMMMEEESAFEVQPENSFLDEETPAPSPFLEIFEDDVDGAPIFEEFTDHPDDFTVIDGISTKIAKLLVQSDIQTYQQLARTDVEKLQVVLAGAGIFLTDPSSWPEQARLASEDRWEDLRKYQEEIKGGL